ncbi:hypothetical protein [Parabacteroides goldsteinii]|uniref:hypothetical protein n=1 Tax=Parabacteroides goldsteinii TaxID=328812 RepID=UPI002576A5FF|nr:hypothetical protein [Parabacteroides goldsteinii]
MENAKKDFTKVEQDLIETVCHLYGIQSRTVKDGVFTGIIPNNVRITLNGTYFLQLLNTTNAVYIEMKEGINILTIVAQ